MSTPFTQFATPLERSAVICRGCLAESGEMKNIYEWGLSEDFFQITSIIETIRTPGLSELLCSNCEQTMNSYKQFREQCQESDRRLKSSLKKNKKTKKLKNEIKCELQDKKLVVKIQAPKTEEKILLPCPFHCKDKFKKKNDLSCHLKKVHNVSDDFVVELHFHCAESHCVYNLNTNGEKWFSGRKFLNQHTVKVHMARGITCKDCKMNFPLDVDYQRHRKTCNYIFICQICNVKYTNNEALMVHLKRKHPDVHKMYKDERKAEKRRLQNLDLDLKKKDSIKILQTLTLPETTESGNTQIILESFPLRQAESPQENLELQFSESPKKSLATQIPEDLTNDVTLLSWPKNYYETRTDDNSTQTVFGDPMSIQNSDNEMFFPEIISLSDIQTQTLEFGLSRSNKETQIKSSETQSPDLSIKETQTCFCHFETSKSNFFDSLSVNNLTSTETQTADRFSVKSDVLLSFNSAETQTCFDESSNDSM